MASLTLGRVLFLNEARVRQTASFARAVAPILACAVYWKFGPEWPYIGGVPLLLISIVVCFTLPKGKAGQDSGTE